VKPRHAVAVFMTGALTMAALAVGLGAVRTSEPQVGRFQISAGNDDAYVVDTITGKVWSARGANGGLYVDKLPTTQP
jgi:hypothetical protein